MLRLMRKIKLSIRIVALVLLCGFFAMFAYACATMVKGLIGVSLSLSLWQWGIVLGIIVGMVALIAIVRSASETPDEPDVTIKHPDGSYTDVWYHRKKK